MKFKSIVFIMMIAAIALSSCNTKKNKTLTSENEALKTENVTKDSLLNDLFQSFVTIEENLSDITSSEQIITGQATAGEKLNDDVRQQIMEEIQTINFLLDSNKKQLEELRKKLKDSGIKVESLQKTIDLLTARLEQKDQEIAVLKEELVKLNFEVDMLNVQVAQLQDQNENQAEIIEMQFDEIDEMNTVWYAVGTKKYLMDNGIIEKSGKFLSNTKQVNPLVEAKLLTKADLRVITEVNVNSSKAVLVTVHPEGSYEWVMDGKLFVSLKILDPSEFWKVSKYLVIETS